MSTYIAPPYEELLKSATGSNVAIFNLCESLRADLAASIARVAELEAEKLTVIEEGEKWDAQQTDRLTRQRAVIEAMDAALTAFTSLSQENEYQGVDFTRAWKLVDAARAAKAAMEGEDGG